jgi:pSer/pThr/pTyr-binding forkhead associated (FHA) protein
MERRDPVSATFEDGISALKVVIYRAGCYCGSEVFVQPEVLIGRDGRSDLTLRCEMVSRAHAVVRLEPHGLVIEDSGSHNGIRLNGERVFRACPRPEDKVTVGTFELRFVLYGDPSWNPIREVRPNSSDREITQVDPPPASKTAEITALVSRTTLVRRQRPTRRTA